MNIDTQEKLEWIYQEFINLTTKISQYSPAIKRKVGAVIYENGSCYYGYNGLPDTFNSPTRKCENPQGITYDYVIHAEEAAIFSYLKGKGNHLVQNPILICTYSPCMNCCKLIVQANIKTVYYLDEHATNFTFESTGGGLSPKDFLLKNCVTVERLSREFFVEKGFDVRQFEFNPRTIPPFDEPTKERKIALIFHSKDNDGFMCGALLKQMYKHEVNDGSAELIPYDYDDFNAEWLTSTDYEEYVFADITPPNSWIDRMIEKQNIVNSITIYDHHYTEHERLSASKISDLCSNFTYEYADDKSACEILFKTMSLNYFAPSFSDPTKNTEKIMECYDNLVRLISYYDTWKFVKDDFYINNKHMSNLDFDWLFNKDYILQLNSYLYLFRDFGKFINIISNVLTERREDAIQQLHYFIQRGEIVLMEIDLINEKIIEKTYYGKTENFVLFQGNMNYQIQEYFVLKRNPGVLMISYSIDLNKKIMKFSLRGKGAGALAKQFLDGGGHAEAAGFSLPLTSGYEYLETLINK